MQCSIDISSKILDEDLLNSTVETWKNHPTATTTSDHRNLQ
jgi:hypothetical protein